MSKSPNLSQFVSKNKHGHWTKRCCMFHVLTCQTPGPHQSSDMNPCRGVSVVQEGTEFIRKNGSRWDINWGAKTLGNFGAAACNTASKKLIVRNWKCVNNVCDVDENCKDAASQSAEWKVMFKVNWMVNFITFQDILLHLLVLNCWKLKCIFNSEVAIVPWLLI